jgi:hypothetical protein
LETDMNDSNAVVDNVTRICLLDWERILAAIGLRITFA